MKSQAFICHKLCLSHISFTHTVEALQPCFAGKAGLDLHYELTATGGATGLFFYIIPREE